MTVSANSRRASRFQSSGTRIALALLMASASVTFMADPVHAQESNASLRGVITTGGAASGATQVVAVEVDTGARRTATVQTDGGYNLASLRPGTYRLEITTPSGVRQTDEFTLEVAQNAVLDIDLAAIQPETAETPGTPPPSETPAAAEGGA